MTTVQLQLQAEAVSGVRSFIVTAVVDGTLPASSTSPETAGALTDQTVGALMQPAIDKYVADNKLTDPVAVTRFAVSTNTVNVQVYFSPGTQNQVTTDAGDVIYGHNIVAKALPGTPPLVGEAKSTTAILWQWGRVDGLGYRLLDEYENVLEEFLVDELSFLETNLIPNETYTRKVVAFNTDGQGTPSAPVAITTLISAPGAPVNFLGIAEPNGQVTWVWEAYGDADGYYLMDAQGTVLQTISFGQTSAIETGLPPATPLTRQLVAYNRAGRSAVVTATVEILHLASDFPVPPLAPAKFIGVAKSPNAILWSWANMQGVNGFHLYDESGSEIALIPPFQHEYLESGLLPDVGYTRYITAYNKDGESAPSTLAVVTTLNDYARGLREQAPIEVVTERLKAFQSGVGDGRDLFVKRPNLDKPVEQFDYEMFVQGYIDKVVQVHPTVSFQFRYKVVGEHHSDSYSGHFTADVTGANGAAVVNVGIKDGVAETVDLATLVGPGPYTVSKTGGDANTFAYFPSKPYERTSDGAVTGDEATVTVEASARLVVSPYTGLSEWYTVSLNGRQPLTSPGAGRSPLRMPLTMEVPKNVQMRTYSVEVQGVAPAAATVDWFWDAGEVDKTTKTEGDSVNFTSDYAVDTTLRTVWRGAKVRGDSRTVSPDKRVRFMEKLPTPALDPTWTADVKDYKVVVTTTNPNVAMSMIENQAIAWTTTGVPFIAMDFEAWVLNPTQTAWAPQIHNGYYYLNNHEFYLFAKDEVKSRIAAEAIYRTLQVLYSIRAYGERFTSAETRLYTDADQGDFVQGSGSGVTTTLVPGKITIRTDADGRLLPVGEYLSTVKEFPRMVASWEPVEVVYTVPSGGKVEVLTRSFAEGSWSPWEPVRAGNVPASPPGIKFQYRLILHAGGDKTLTYPTFAHDTADELRASTLLDGIVVADDGAMSLAPGRYEGYVVGPVVDLGTTSIESMGRLSSDMSAPAGTSVTFYSVTSDSPNGPWDGTGQPWIKIFGDGNIRSAKKRYVTWVAVFKTTNLSATPSFTQVWIQPTLYTVGASSPEIDSVTVGGYLNEQRQVEIYTLTKTASIPANKLYYQVTDLTIAGLFEEEFAEKQIDTSNLTVTGYDITTQDPGVVFKYSTDGSSTVQAATTTQAFANAYYQERVVVSRANRAEVSPLPQQGAPVIINDRAGVMRQVFFMGADGKPSLTNTEETPSPGGRQVALGYPGIDPATLRVWIDHTGRGEWTPSMGFRVDDNILTLAENLDRGTVVRVMYRLTRSFTVDYDYAPERDTAMILLHEPILDESRVVSVHYECATDTAYYQAREVNINPLSTPLTAGFLYLTDDVEVAKRIEMRFNPSILNANGYDRTTIFIRATDRFGNPVVGDRIKIEATGGQVRLIQDTTDAYGMATATFHAPEKPGDVVITVRDLTAGLSTTGNIHCRGEGENATLSVEADKATFSLILPDDQVRITARTINQVQNYEAGNSVIFESTWGMLVGTPGDTGSSSYTGITDPNGVARVYLKRIEGEAVPANKLVTVSVKVLTQEGYQLTEEINVRLVEV